MGHHCGDVKAFEGVPLLSCKKPPGHEGIHKDRLWVADNHYFFVEWPKPNDALYIHHGVDLTPLIPSGSLTC